MKTIGNILWLILTGLESALLWLVFGLLWCVTIIGIPFGIQCFKFARLSFWPFGSNVNTRFCAHPIVNIIWIFVGGIELALVYCAFGLLWCVTIIGIPFGIQCFKLAQLALAPFGAEIR